MDCRVACDCGAVSTNDQSDSAEQRSRFAAHFPGERPTYRTFYMLSTMGTNGFGPPWPFNPVEQLQPDVFWLGSNTFLNADPGSFIIDDTSIDYSALQQQQMMTSDAPSLPGDPGPGSGDDTNSAPMLAYSYETNAFYLEVEPQWLTNVVDGVTNTWVGVVLHSTVPDVAYDLLSKTTLTDAVWTVEQTLVGTEDQDWTFTCCGEQPLEPVTMGALMGR
jgi:hypothetical protein